MRQFSIRNKLFVAFSLLGLIALSTGFYFVYNNAKDSLQTSIKDQLQTSTTLITTLVQSVASTSIENHLQSIAETQLLLVTSLYEEHLSGRFSEYEAKRIAAKTLGKQVIGTSGYFYCIDSQGNVPVHRDKKVANSNILSFPFIQDQVRLKTGYMEYRWTSPGEKVAREKALYMVYFEPWDWIISASTYKSEFTYLIDIENLRKALAKITFGEQGYPFILGTNGDAIYHPSLSGNLYDVGVDSEAVLSGQQILKQKEGTIYYRWKNPNDSEAREKISILEFLPDYNWVLGSSSYLDELHSPLERMQKILLLIFLLYGLLLLSASFGLSTLVTQPLKKLITHFKDKTATDVALITDQFSNDEVGKLAGYLNQFIKKLSEHHVQLESEIYERERSERTFHTLFDHSFQFIALLDPDGFVCKINKTALSFRNLSETDVVGELFWETPWWRHSSTLVAQLKEAFADAQKGVVCRFEGYSNEIREVYLDISLKPVLDENGQLIYIIAEAREITELRTTERDLQQVQKMESVGTLAGGIAHDFNNILGGILGTVDLLKLKRERDGAISEVDLIAALDTIDDTALRAKDIVNQLLTLSRKYDLNVVSTDLSEVLSHVSQIGRNSFDKSITIKADFDDEIAVKGDANSLEQVFLNVCINAAHAMTIMRGEGDPWGGVLSLRADKVIGLEQPGHGIGDYWAISIVDTGVGMDSSVIEKIFTPFYSTKDKDFGTGLGLSMVFNIIRQHHGFINIESTVGAGSHFKIFLPACDDQVTNKRIRPGIELESGEGLILIVDDEKLIRDNACEILQACGYTTLQAENGLQGVELYQQHQGDICVVLLDLAMPVMSGKEAFVALKKINPEVKVLLNSGFRHDSRVDEILSVGSAGYIQKPYSLFDLSKAVKDMLSE